MAPRHHMGWKIEFAITLVILALMAAWIVGAKDARAGDYEGTFHLAPHVDEIIKQEGMVLWRIIDGPVRCYIVITEARMIGMQSSLSCVIPDKEKKEAE